MNTSVLKDLLRIKSTGAYMTLAVAESLTCGHLQARIGAISGASNFFLGGITAYTLEQKIKLLGVPRNLAEPVNCVSEQVALVMAQGVRTLFGSDIGVATTGYAEPDLAQNVPQPFAWFAIVHGKETLTRRIDCAGTSRIAVQERVAATTFNTLIEFLT